MGAGTDLAVSVVPCVGAGGEDVALFVTWTVGVGDGDVDKVGTEESGIEKLVVRVLCARDDELVSIDRIDEVIEDDDEPPIVPAKMGAVATGTFETCEG